MTDYPATLAITRLSLTAFRNYADLRLDLAVSPVVLTGANGSGKTNLLEAVSLLVPGRGLRRADLADLQNNTVPACWGAAFTVQTPAGELQIGTGRDTGETDATRRAIQIDGRVMRGQQALAEQVAMAWITPDMDRILAESASPRRKLLDRLVYSFDPAHATRVNRYEKALRERARLLREGRADPQWLDALEDEMAQTGTAIAAARRQLLRQLRGAIDEADGAFPPVDLTLQGLAEAALEDQPALTVEDDLRAALARSRSDDAQSGMTAIGPHRSDLLAVHRAKQCPAALCSTGEQKALLIALMLAYARVLSRHRGMPPLFLLDDIAAHLDDIRRVALFEELRSLKVQAWLTGTDVAIFAPLLPYAQHLNVEQGRVA